MKMKTFCMVIIMSLLASCTEKETEGGTIFLYSNDSNHNVLVKVYNAALPNISSKTNKEYNLEKGEEFKLDYVYKGSKCGELPFGGTADSVTIIFDSNKQITYDPKEQNNRNMLNLESYELVNTNKDVCTYQYSITQDDYISANE